jgi:hypothetical protein
MDAEGTRVRRLTNFDDAIVKLGCPLRKSRGVRTSTNGLLLIHSFDPSRL